MELGQPTEAGPRLGPPSGHEAEPECQLIGIGCDDLRG